MFFIFLASSICFTVLAQLFLKEGVLGLGQINLSFSGMSQFFFKFVSNSHLVLGLCFFAMAFFCWLLTLSKIKLSVAYPISTALNLSFVTLASYFIFKESLSALQILGIIIIVVGIFLLLWKY